MNTQEKTLCEQIYERNHERINWYLWKYYGWLGNHDVYDIMQEVWKELSLNIADVGQWNEAAQWGWLVKVANNKVISLARLNTRNYRLAEKAEVVYTEATPADCVEEAVVQKVLAENVMQKLSVKDKRTLFEQFYPTEVSEISKKRDNASVCKAYRARKKLQKYMKEGGLDA